MQPWRVVVLPLEVHHLVAEFAVVVLPVAQIHHQIVVEVLLVQHLRHVVDVVTVQRLHPRSRIRHRDYPRRDISQVQVERSVLETHLLTRHHCTNIVHIKANFVLLRR